jgi:Transmembrane domain of unknown function (DUF3566)
VSDSVNPAGSRPGGGRGYGAPARPGDPAASSGSLPTSPLTASDAPPQVSGFGRTIGRVGSAVAAGVQTASSGTRAAGGAGAGAGAAARPVGSQVRVRKARLRLARVDPWSVMKVSFVLSIALGIVSLVGTAVVWEVLNSLGVFSSLNKTVGDLTSGGSGSDGFDLSSVLSFTRVEGYMLIVALVDVVLVTALATLGSYLYNLSSGFVGGLEVTLAEDQ